jgi:hypothetical protein
MPVRPSKNVVQKLIEFPPEVASEVERFAAGRGETFKAVVLHALRRHLKYPPPPPEPEPAEPLPDSPTAVGGEHGIAYGRIIREFREAAPPVTQDEFAALTGLPLDRVRAIEAGSTPTHGELLCISDAIGDSSAFMTDAEHQMMQNGRQSRATARRAAKGKGKK